MLFIVYYGEDNMPSIKVDAILFIQRYSGLPLITLKLNPRVFDIDPTLVSGFLMAIQAFSGEIIERGSQEFQIDYGKRVFTVVVGAESLAVAVTSEGPNDGIIPVITELQSDFEANYYVDLEIYGNSNVYDEFKLKIAERFGLQDVSENWIPYDKQCEGSEIGSYSIAPYITGSASISEIIRNSGMSSDEVTAELSQLWIMGLIDFKNTLERCDVIIPTSSFFKYTQAHTSERNELEKYSSKLTTLLPRLALCFDGRTTVEEIVQSYGSETYDLLDMLMNRGALQILTPEKKRILLVKELLEKSIEIASNVYSKDAVLKALSDVLSVISRPEVVTEVRILQDGWDIDFGFRVYDGLDPNEVMQIHSVWIDLLVRFTEALPDGKKKKYAEALAVALQEEFFDKYAGTELDGFEDFSLSLESELL